MKTNSRKERGIVDYENMWKQLYAESFERMDKYAPIDRYTYQIFRALVERMEQLEKENDE